MGERDPASAGQARSLYGAGLAGFIDVLDARRTALRQQRELVRANAAAARQGVVLFEAMGEMPDAVPGADAARESGA